MDEAVVGPIFNYDTSRKNHHYSKYVKKIIDKQRNGGINVELPKTEEKSSWYSRTYSINA